MAITRTSPLNRCGSGVFASQSQQWLTEPFAHAPQVRLVLGEESPQFPDRDKKFVEQ
jgi:hypothetical protein